MRVSILIVALASILLLTDCGRVARRTMTTVDELSGGVPRGYAGDTKNIVLKPDGPSAGQPSAAERQAQQLRPTRKPRVSRRAVRPAIPSVARLTPPPGVERRQREREYAESGFAWNDISEYDAANPSLAGGGAPPPSSRRKLSIPVLKDDVTVFPVDGDSTPYYADMRFTYIQPEPPSTPYPEPLPLPAPPETSSYSSGYSPPVEMADDSYSSALPPVAASRRRSGDEIAHEQVFFAYGSSKIGKDDHRVLKTIAAHLPDRGSYEVRVVGHASKRVDGVEDPIKKKMINFEMAQKRANAVAREMYAAGVKPAWVMALSKGDEEPNPTPDGKDQEAADRRADVYVDGVKLPNS